MPDESEAIKLEDHILGYVCGCALIVTYDDKGGGHIEASCKTKEGRDKLAAILEKESILRIDPKVVLED
ncbi:hypothetical protein ES708_32616 [subsurface metagenome]